MTFDMKIFLNFIYLIPCKDYVDIYNDLFAQLKNEKLTRFTE